MNSVDRHIFDALNERCGAAEDERDRYREALKEIVRMADEAPMEDVLGAGPVARAALSREEASS